MLVLPNRLFVLACVISALGALRAGEADEFASARHGIAFQCSTLFQILNYGDEINLRLTESGVDLRIAAVGAPDAPLGGLPPALVAGLVLDEEEERKQGTMRGRFLRFGDKHDTGGMVAFVAVPHGQPLSVLARYTDKDGARAALNLVGSLRLLDATDKAIKLETIWRDLEWERQHAGDLVVSLSGSQRAMQSLDYRSAALQARQGLKQVDGRTLRIERTRELVDALQRIEREAVQRGMLQAGWAEASETGSNTTEAKTLDLGSTVVLLRQYGFPAPVATAEETDRFVAKRPSGETQIATFESIGPVEASHRARLLLRMPPDDLPMTVRNLALLLALLQTLAPDADAPADWIASVCENGARGGAREMVRRVEGRVLRLRRYAALDLLELRISPLAAEAEAAE